MKLPTQVKPVVRQQSPTQLKAAVKPSGCCGVQVCAPLVGCHCAGVESPFC